MREHRREKHRSGLLRFGAIAAFLAIAALVVSGSVDVGNLPERFGQSRTAAAQDPAPETGDEAARPVGGAVGGRVVRVIDGDSLVADVQGSGRLEIRLAWIDAPELGQSGGAESKRTLGRILRRGNVRFELLDRDRHGRTIALAWVENASVNEEMVRHGHAWVYERYVPASHRPRYRALADLAKHSGSGLWGGGSDPVPPREWRKRTRGG